MKHGGAPGWDASFRSAPRRRGTRAANCSSVPGAGGAFPGGSAELCTYLHLGSDRSERIGKLAEKKKKRRSLFLRPSFCADFQQSEGWQTAPKHPIPKLCPCIKSAGRSSRFSPLSLYASSRSVLSPLEKLRAALCPFVVPSCVIQERRQKPEVMRSK